MGYGRAEYEEARKASAQVWDDPNAHVGGPIWVGKTKVTTVGLKDNKRYKIRQLNNLWVVRLPLLFYFLRRNDLNGVIYYYKT